jgi:hypothetical protein
MRDAEFEEALALFAHYEIVEALGVWPLDEWPTPIAILANIAISATFTEREITASHLQSTGVFFAT